MEGELKARCQRAKGRMSEDAETGQVVTRARPSCERPGALVPASSLALTPNEESRRREHGEGANRSEP